MNRKKSREVAMKLLFEMFIKKEDYKDILDSLKENTDVEVNEANELLGEKKEKDLESIDLEDVDMAYVTRILKGVQENTDKIDEKIEKYLKNWKLNRLAKTDLVILRMCTYEVMFEEEIPNKVSVNEAVELAKKYCEDKSPSFINGVLDKVIKEQ